MSKTLTLKPRGGQGGIPRWYDYIAVENALTIATQGKRMAARAVIVSILRKIEIARVESAGEIRDIEIELEDGEAKVFWKEIDQPAEAFGRDAITGQLRPPKQVLLDEMLRDFADQLGEDMPT